MHLCSRGIHAVLWCIACRSVLFRHTTKCRQYLLLVGGRVFLADRPTLIRRVRHIWQPLEGFPQYTMVGFAREGKKQVRLKLGPSRVPS